MTIKFTLGMAVYEPEDGDGSEAARCEFTAMGALIGQPFVDEVIIVDNNPGPHTQYLADLRPKSGGKIRYHPMPEPTGTAAPRNKVFELAKNDHVVCIDPHVILYPNAVYHLAEMYAKDLYSPDLFHGPLMTEKGEVYATHMNYQWRGEMLGTWGRAWESPNGILFSVITPDDKYTSYVDLPFGKDEQKELSAKELGLPEVLVNSGHEKVLRKLGCKEPSTPYQVPGHGMGLFACRKDAWADGGYFSPYCRGFGGEEITTGMRFRKLGRRVWSVPGAKWWHRFRDPHKELPYPASKRDKIRNYVIEFVRLGRPLNEIRAYFDDSHATEDDWNDIVQEVKRLGTVLSSTAPPVVDLSGLTPDLKKVSVMAKEMLHAAVDQIVDEAIRRCCETPGRGDGP